MGEIKDAFIIKEDGTIKRAEHNNASKKNNSKANKIWAIVGISLSLIVMMSFIISQIIEAYSTREFIEADKRTSSGTIDGHYYVDLGLSVQWATCNIGAEYSSQYGEKYAWGELSTKDEYTPANSKTTGWNIDNIAKNPQYDVANVQWGKKWHIPTEKEYKELLDSCIWEETLRNGVAGYFVKGPSGKAIFFPLATKDECYWTSTCSSNSSESICLIFSTFLKPQVSSLKRHRAAYIRPVCDALIQKSDTIQIRFQDRDRRN